MTKFLAAVLLLASLGRVAAADQPECGGFVGPVRLPVEGFPAGIASADFNGDGLPDVATIGGPTISVRLGDPGSGLGPLLTSAGPDNPGILVAGDFDGAGADLVTTDFFGTMNFLHGNGDGTFGSPVEIASYGPSSLLAAADVDGDGKLDLIGINGKLVVYLGHGDGTFDAPIGTPINVYATSMAFADLNGDGRLDVVIGGSYQDRLVVLLGNGDGTFAAPTVLDSTNAWSALVLADFDGDGKIDLVGMESFQTLEFLHGNGDGTFGPAVPSPLPVLPELLVSTDLDGDGILDLVAPLTDGQSTSGGGLQVLIGRGDGTFRAGDAYATGTGSPFAIAGDFNGDGLADVVVLPNSSSEVWWMRGKGDGTLVATPVILFGAPSFLLTSGDFNEDGITDIAVAGYSFTTQFSSAVVGLGQRSQQFSFVGVEPTERFFQSVATGDFHESGHLDLAYLSFWNGTAGISLFRGNGDGTFGFEELQPLTVPIASQAYPMIAGRFGADVHVDLLLAVWDPVALFESILILHGDGQGGFVPQTAATSRTPLTAIAAADFNGDGVLDLVTVESGSPGGFLRIWFGASNGTFVESPPYPVGSFPSCVIVADIDGDGAADVLVGDYASSAVLILHGDGHGNFTPPLGVAAGSPTLSLAVADINGDGIADIVTASGNVALLLGYGDGTFTAPRAWVCGAYSNGLAIGDFDADGTLDAALSGAEPFQGGVSILWNERSTSIAVSPTNALLGQAASLSAQGGGAAAVTYRWSRNGVPMTDGGSISGSNTPTLTISPATFADAASYSVSVTDACGTLESNAAPLTVEFADVPVSSPFHGDILTIATAGITSGCGGSNYCPASPVRRDQMAVFLLKAEHGASYVPPACTGLFADVPCPSAYADWVEQLSIEGVTSGCGGGNYCPSASVTRAQMAVFLLKTKNGSAYAPPAAVGLFGDVPVGSFAADFIEALYNQGITGGCQLSPLLYCPGSAVLRQQMATFLVRTFGL